MTLTLDPPEECGWPPEHWFQSWSRTGATDIEVPPEDGRPWNYIFCSDELPEFCRLLLSNFQHRLDSLRETVLYINIHSAITNGQAEVIDNHPAGRARMERFLGPLRQLHSLGAAQIDGPLSGSYKGEIIRSICRHCPTAMDVVHAAIASLKQADEQASRSQLRHANLGYKATLSLLRSCYWHHQEKDFIMSDGPFPGLEAHKVVDNFVVRLQARIAAVYYKINQLRMARIYTRRAMDRRLRDHPRGRLDIEAWEHTVYA